MNRPKKEDYPTGYRSNSSQQYEDAMDKYCTHLLEQRDELAELLIFAHRSLLEFNPLSNTGHFLLTNGD